MSSGMVSGSKEWGSWNDGWRASSLPSVSALTTALLISRFSASIWAKKNIWFGLVWFTLPRGGWASETWVPEEPVSIDLFRQNPVFIYYLHVFEISRSCSTASACTSPRCELSNTIIKRCIKWNVFILAAKIGIILSLDDESWLHYHHLVTDMRICATLSWKTETTFHYWWRAKSNRFE
jgi:hypothetical protein